MNVMKASGLEEKFSSKKIYHTILEAGGSGQLARKIIEVVKKRYHEDITTKEILEIILHELKDFPSVQARYDLKRAIMTLGPSGFPFEQFFGDVLRHYGYKTEIGNFVKGKIITHEIDIIAKKEKSYMIECKYHNEAGTSTSLHPALYTYARFLDLRKKLDMPWLVTNTKCSQDAKNYAKGVGLKITSWNFPKNESLQKLIKLKKLYPITILKTINEDIREKLFQTKIVIAKNILNYSIEDLMKKTELNEKEINKILKEVRIICD